MTGSDAMAPIGKLVVVGVGLIGGSCALALKARGEVGEVVGVGRSAANLDQARALGVADRTIALDGPWLAELAHADVVLVAAPVAQYPALFAAMAPAIGADTVVTDAGSTKQDVVAAARATFGAALTRFVPAHPIAGSERSGAAAAFASLYEGRDVIVTPLPETSLIALAQVESLWTRCGARLRRLDPAIHDDICAAMSHLPHLLAFAFVDTLASRPDADVVLDLAGAGFRDFTRIAASSPEMWRDIFRANRAALLHALSDYRGMLDRFEAAIGDDDPVTLDALIERSRRIRCAWGARAGETGSADAA